MDTPHETIARRVAALFAPMPEVVAVALEGSRGAGGLGGDAGSDIDVGVYTRGEIALPARRAVVEAAGGASVLDLGMTFWGPGDEWVDAATGIHVDVVYFDAAWMADQVDRVLVRHEAQLGYTTCFWHTIRGCVALEDGEGWLAGLKARAAASYPDELRTAIVAFNRAAMRGHLPSLAGQVARAAARADLVSVNHRLAALLACYFDVVFAVNLVPHPGEKLLVEAAGRLCATLPEAMAEDVAELLESAATDLGGLPGRVERLLDRLDAVLAAEGLAGG